MYYLVDIKFDSPLWFLLGIVVPLTIWWYIKRYKRNLVTLVHSAPPVIKIRKSFKQRTVHFPFFLRMLALVLFIVAMARPQGFMGDEERDTEGIDIVFALDVSWSMLAKDLEPNRLEVAKKLCVDFVKNRKHDRFGFVVFSGEAVSKTPLTLDHERLIQRIKDTKAGSLLDGTHIGIGLGTAVARLEGSEAKSKVIILLTDGVNNGGEVSPLTAAELAASMGVRVYVIGVGTKGMAESFVGVNPFTNEPEFQFAPVEIDEVTLQQIADKTQGKYFRAVDNNSLENIFKEIDVLEKSKLKTNEQVNRPDLFYGFVLLGALIFMLELVLRLTYYRSVI
jgi:Ca-activated chloride channel family protein